MEGASTSKKRRKETRQRKDYTNHNTAFQGSILEMQHYANDDGLSVIFFTDKHSWQL